MKYMLDTNIMIYCMKHKPIEVYNNLQKCDIGDVCISSVTYAELQHGIEKSKNVLRNKLALDTMLANIEVLNFDINAAEYYGKIKADLENKGTPIGPLDTLIAGHAKSIDCILVTNNTKEFNRVNNLKLENWVNN